MEEWREIKNNPKYEVSSFGNVRSKARGLISIDKKRYCYASIYYDDVIKRCLVHRLVAEAFIDNPQNKPIIDHKNNNKYDNNVNNLRWVSQQENLWNKPYKGYSKRPNGKYEVKIRNNDGKRIYVGIYETEEEARNVYMEKARELRGEFCPGYDILGK